MSWRKQQLFPFTHCPLVSHCQQSPRILCRRLSCLLTLDHDVSIEISSSDPKILISYSCLLETSFLHSFQSVITPQFAICDNQVDFFWWVSRSYTNTVLSFSNCRILYLYNPSRISSNGIFVIDHLNYSHFESNSRISSFWRLTVSEQLGIVRSSKQSVNRERNFLLLNFSSLQTDSSFEMKIMDDFVQYCSNPRVKFVKISNHSTHLQGRKLIISSRPQDRLLQHSWFL